MNQLAQKANNQDDSVTVILIKDLKTTLYANKLNKFINSSPFAHPKQTVSWALSKNETSNYFIVLTLKNDIIIAYSLIYATKPILGKLSKYFIEGGPIVHSIDALPIHLKHLQLKLKHSGLWISIRPYFLSQDTKLAIDYLEQCEFISKNKNSSCYVSTINIDLNEPISQIKKGFRRSLRTQINKANKLGLDPEYCNSEDIFLKFINAYNNNAIKNHFDYIDSQEGINIFNTFCRNGKSGQFIAILQGKILIGGVVLLATGNRVFFEWGYSSRQSEHRKLPLGHILQWTAINWAKQHNYEIYDFGGYWLERGDNDPINRFKTGFSKNIQPVLPEHIFYLSPILGRIINIISHIKSMLIK